MSTFQQFRSVPTKVAELRKALELPIVQEALHTLIENGPEKRAVPLDITPHGAQIMLGQSRGYAEFHSTLLMLAVHPAQAGDVPVTYEPPEESGNSDRGTRK